MQLTLLGLAWLCAHAFGFSIVPGHDNESITVRCEPGEFMDDYSFLLDISHWKRLIYLDLKHCPLPPVSFATTLKKFNISESNLVTLILDDIIMNTSFINRTLFEGLSIEVLHIINMRNLTNLHKNVLKPLTSLKTLYLHRVQLPTLPDTNQLEFVSLGSGESIGEWGGCAQLQRLQLSEWEVPALNTNWLEHCPKLKELHMNQLTEHAVNRTLSGARALTSLVLEKCSVAYLSKNLLADAMQLQRLRIANHYAVEGVDVDLLKGQRQLKQLDLEEVHSRLPWEMARMVHQAKALRELTINIYEFDFCGEFNQLPPLPLERLTLLKVWSVLCLGNWTSLMYLDLDPCCGLSKFSYQLYQEMPMPHDHPIVINYREEIMNVYLFEESNYQDLQDKFSQADNVTMLVNQRLVCDCDNGWFASMLRSLTAAGRLSVRHVRCWESGELILDVPPQHFECDKTKDGECIIRKYWKTSHGTQADCRGIKLRSLPLLPPGVHTLLASQNYIDTLPQGFNESLMVVDLHDNRISSMSVPSAHSLFSNPARNVSLAGNPLVCNCDNEQLIIILIANKKQILDFDNMTCIVNGVPRPLQYVDSEDLCRAQRDRDRKVLVIAATVCTLLAVMAFLAILCYRYWREVRILLYARGWCLCCVREDELDSDRPYDAFISFAHGDEQLIAEHLLPGLEREHLKLCVHTRDWIPGEMITTQIERSVEMSRRTVVVLSRNFVRSLWGMTEFRTAHMRAMSEGRVRLVVIVLDDVVDSQDLDADLRRYLRTSTYLRWEDPWFWRRLMFALPHRRSGPQPRSINLTGGSDVPPAEPAVSRAMQMSGGTSGINSSQRQTN